MKSIIANNTVLQNMTANIKKAQKLRVDTVNALITDVLIEGKKHDTFTSRKAANKYVVQNLLEDVKTDAYTKRAVVIAGKIIVDGYKAKRELLTFAQLEQLLKFKVERVNALMTLEDDDYINAVKELIKSAKVERKVKVFSAKKAIKA